MSMSMSINIDKYLKDHHIIYASFQSIYYVSTFLGVCVCVHIFMRSQVFRSLRYDFQDINAWVLLILH